MAEWTFKAYRSRWFKAEEIRDFKKAARPGDAIEFHRGIFYSHWGIYIGEETLKDRQDHWIVHLASPAEAGMFFVVSQSNSLHKRAAGLGNPQATPLEDILEGCHFRINNSKDKQHRPLNRRDIVRRAISALDDYDQYDLKANNCEHFASWCRYSKKLCDQFYTLKVIVALLVVVVGIVLVYAFPTMFGFGSSTSSVKNRGV